MRLNKKIVRRLAENGLLSEDCIREETYQFAEAVVENVLRSEAKTAT